MIQEDFRFNVGEFKCHAIADGEFTYGPPLFPPPVTFLFSNASLEILRQLIPRYQFPAEKWVSSYTPLVIDTGNHRILVDTGGGNLGPRTGQLHRNLRSAGIEPASIDTVVFTHGHPDHIGGTINHEGKWTFPKARYCMAKAEWDFWNSGFEDREQSEPAFRHLLALFQRSILPIRERLELVGHDHEIVPGVRMLHAPGHTPGHMTLEVTSQGKRLICCSDLFLHPIHIEKPEWHALTDTDPRQLARTRHRCLTRAGNEETLFHCFHFPFPGAGYIVSEGDRQWRWHPVERYDIPGMGRANSPSGISTPIPRQ